MNRQLRRLGIGMMVLYGVLFAQLNRLQFFGAEDLREDPINTRAIVANFNHNRGRIVTLDGEVIAESVALPPEASFDYERRYPFGDLYGHVTGFFSFNFGASGVESTYNDYLAGDRTELQIQELSDLFVERDPSADVTLTLRHDVQQVARDALGDLPGSVVAIDPRTGAIRAMWSNPSYDPSVLSTTDLPTAARAWDLLNANEAKPLLARSYREIFFPGSTFKLVTAAAGLESGAVTPATPVYPTTNEYVAPLTNRPLRNFGGSTCGGTLLEILRVSCNTAFAEMGAEDLGPASLIERAEAFGFNERPPIDLPAPATSQFPTDFGARLGPISDYVESSTSSLVPDDSVPADQTQADAGEVSVFEDTPLLAQAAIGQFDVRATPLEMAQVAGAIANDGLLMKPHVMAVVRNRNAEAVEDEPISLWKQAVSPSVASTLRQAMIGVVQNGTASRLSIDGFEVGGKTGTAQLGTEEPQSHAWIVGFAGRPGEQPEIAVAVLVEAQPGASEQTGGRVAAPIARAVMEAALAPMPIPPLAGGEGD